jgi:hypothetical protein
MVIMDGKGSMLGKGVKAAGINVCPVMVVGEGK